MTMIGSLQEFLGAVDKDKFLSSEKKKKKSWSLTLKPRSLQKTSRNNTANQNNNQSHISSIKYGTQRQDYISSSRERWRLSSKESIDDSQIIRKTIKKSKWAQHVPDDKKNVLKVFEKLRRREQIQKNAKLLQKSKQMQNKVKPKQSYLHLKAGLKHEHQLLRSIIRVQQQGLINPKTFLEMSLESLTSSVNRIKMKPVLHVSKEDSQRLLSSIQEKETNDVADKLQQLRRQVVPSFLKNKDQGVQKKYDKVYQSQRMLLWNTLKWSKKRAKSTKSYEKELGIEEKAQTFQTELTNNRKQIFKKINDLITQPQNPRKNSLRGSVRFFK